MGYGMKVEHIILYWIEEEVMQQLLGDDSAHDIFSAINRLIFLCDEVTFDNCQFVVPPQKSLEARR